jgi:hypothetical protein
MYMRTKAAADDDDDGKSGWRRVVESSIRNVSIEGRGRTLQARGRTAIRTWKAEIRRLSSPSTMANYSTAYSAQPSGVACRLGGVAPFRPVKWALTPLNWEAIRTVRSRAGQSSGSSGLLSFPSVRLRQRSCDNLRGYMSHRVSRCTQQTDHPPTQQRLLYSPTLRHGVRWRFRLRLTDEALVYRHRAGQFVSLLNDPDSMWSSLALTASFHRRAVLDVCTTHGAGNPSLPRILHEARRGGRGHGQPVSV